jgi:Cof subfamily protein (haloacid dehalogenase superfamily)
MSLAPDLPTGITSGGRYGDWPPHPDIAYVVCDVDGTLVGPEHHATPEVVTAVQRAQTAGIRVGVATGRMRDAVTPLIGQLGARGPHIMHNGAEVRDGDDVVASWSLTAAQVDALLAIARSRDDTYVEVYTASGFVVSAWDERARPHWQILDAEPRGVITSASELADEAVLKATFPTFAPGITESIEQAITDVGLLAGTAGSPRTPGLAYINATHPDADKGRALERAAAHLGVPMTAVAAIGDETNDLSMLARAGTAIAMGQAAEVIRAEAHLVVPAVDAHGVAVALDTLVGWAGEPD